ncbi:hypothetical protein, partial [Deinococcus marmoris]
FGFTLIFARCHFSLAALGRRLRFPPPSLPRKEGGAKNAVLIGLITFMRDLSASPSLKEGGSRNTV